MKKLIVEGSLNIKNPDGGLFTLKSHPQELVINYDQSKLPAIPFKILMLLNKQKSVLHNLNQNIKITVRNREIFSFQGQSLVVKDYFATFSFITRSLFC